MATAVHGPVSRRLRARAGGLLLAVLVWACPAVATRQFDTRDGMNQNSVNAIARDDLGFLWFGSDTGLNRFDGRRFTRPPATIAAELDGIAINALASDGDVLWIGTRSDGVKRVDLRRERVASIHPGDSGMPASAVRAMVIDRDHNAWLATDGSGVIRIAWHNGRPALRQYTTGTGGLPHARVWSIAIDGDAVLAGTEAGVARLAAGAERFEPLDFPAPFPERSRANIEEIAADGRGGYWIGTWDDGFFHADTAAVRAIGAAGRANSQRVTSLVLTNGVPTVGFDTGIARYAEACDCLQPLALTRSNDGIAQRAFVRSLAALADGSVLVGTWYNGAFHIPPNAGVFQRVGLARPAGTELDSGHVQSVLEDRNGYLWVGSFGAGLQRSQVPVSDAPITLEPVRIESNTRPGANVVWMIREDRNGRIWVGSDDGLDRYDPADASWLHFPYLASGGGLPGPGVRDLIELEGSEFLVATSSGLALIGRDASIRTIRYAEPGPNEALANTVSAMHRDERGRLWLATHDGLLVLAADYTRLHAFRETALSRGLLRGLRAEPDGSLLLAANRLCRIDTRGDDLRSETLACSGHESGLPEDGIQAIEPGVDGALWLSSLHGLRRLAAGQAEAHAFHAADGLVADEFVPRAAYAGPSGRLYFGSANGLQAFDPRQVLMRSSEHTPLLTEVRVGGRALSALDIGLDGMLDAAAPYARTLSLPPNARQIEVGFTLLGASRESQYVAFRVDGLHDWLPAPEGRSGHDLNLPVGDFKLYLRSGEEGGRATPERLALRIHVAPLWWERRAFQIGAMFAVLAAIGLALRSRIVLSRQREQRLQDEVRIRTCEIEKQKTELALANQQLYELSIRDGLTGVFNRRHALDEARRLLRSERERSMCVALIDLDHFKSINDRFGHIAGDEVLRSFASWLRAQAGPGDVFGRYGGEEFFCLLSDRDITQAKHWADTLLARVRTTEVAGPNCEITITASIGIVAIDMDAELPLEIWIARADAALYRAKSNGRDSVLIG